MKLDSKTSKLILLVTAAVLAVVAFYLFVIPAMQKNSEVTKNNANADLLKAKADKQNLDNQIAAKEEAEKDLETRKAKIEHEIRALELKLKNKALDQCKKDHDSIGVRVLYGSFTDKRQECFENVDKRNDAGFYMHQAVAKYVAENPMKIPFNWSIEASGRSIVWFANAIQ